MLEWFTQRDRRKNMTNYESIEQLPIRLNIRDLGGLQAADGRHVKKGLLYRSSALYFFDEKELEPVQALGLRMILDFRAESGARKRPDPSLDGVEYYNKCAGFQNMIEDLNSPAGLASLLFDEDQKGNTIEVLVSSYMASLAFSNESYRFMFDSLLSGMAPLLFHCSNGKDRTGVAAMLILLALGVPEETVRADYLQSNVSRRAEIEALMKKYKVRTDKMNNPRSFLTMVGGVLPQSADMMMSEILEKYGTYENYMAKEYDFDEEKITRLRDMYLG